MPDNDGGGCSREQGGALPAPCVFFRARVDKGRVRVDEGRVKLHDIAILPAVLLALPSRALMLRLPRYFRQTGEAAEKCRKTAVNVIM